MSRKRPLEVQVELARMCTLLMALVLQLGTIQTQLIEQRTVQRFLVERLDGLQGIMEGMRRDQPVLIQSAIRTEMQNIWAASPSNGAHQHGNPTICRSQLTLVAIPEGLEQTGGSDRIVQLRFVNNNPKITQYTDSAVEWKNGKDVKVAVFENDNQIKQGDLSKVEVDIVSVHSDLFTKRRQENFTKEEFDKQICRSGHKELVLAAFNLNNGEGSLDSICFTESSHGKEWRLAARVKTQVPRVRFEEAVTDPFVVKVDRSKTYAKSYPPLKEDDVHRLVGISPKGKFRDNLVGKGIANVKQLLRHYYIDGSALQELIGMKNRAWKDMIDHAKTCHPGNELYYYTAMEKNYELCFNDFYELVGVKRDGKYTAYCNLDHSQQRKVNNWKKSAYKKFEDLEKNESLIPEYADDGLPVTVSPNDDSSPSIPARPISDHQTALQEFGQRNTLLEQNGNQLASESGQQDPSMHQDENLNYLTQRNILNDQGCPSQLNTPSHSIVAVQEDDLIQGANLSVQLNGNLNSLTTDAAGTSHLLTDGDIQQNPMNEYGLIDDFWRGLSPIGGWVEPDHGHMAYQGVLPDNNETASSSNQFDGHEYGGGGGNWQ
uniref:Uncharacterized protein n=1 Tax=Oryza brachyantha TaxID=4533 RepID=J3LTC5_ORYBR